MLGSGWGELGGGKAVAALKLPLCGPTSFCPFLSILLRTPAGGGAAERPRGPFAAGHGQTITMWNIVLWLFQLFVSVCKLKEESFLQTVM